MCQQPCSGWSLTSVAKSYTELQRRSFQRAATKNGRGQRARTAENDDAETGVVAHPRQVNKCQVHPSILPIFAEPGQVPLIYPATVSLFFLPWIQSAISFQEFPVVFLFFLFYRFISQPLQCGAPKIAELVTTSIYSGDSSSWTGEHKPTYTVVPAPHCRVSD